jgi:hypothetical protein
VIILDSDTIARSNVAKHLKETKWSVGKEEGIEAGNANFVDQIILAMIKEQSSLFMRKLTKQTYIPPSMVHQ